MCVSPLLIRNKQIGNGSNTYTTPVPCGKCPECVKSKRNAWTFRINKELEISSTPLFVTLTYAPEHLPKGGTLVRSDLQKFIKRLRYYYDESNKSIPPRFRPKIRFYACGEYGTKSQRPHYHLLVFNMDQPLLVEKSWKLGFSSALPLVDGGVTYVLKYISKPKQNLHGRLPEFSQMSMRLGANYLTPAIIDYHTSNLQNCFITLKGGITMSMPKYYKEKIYPQEARAKVTKILQTRSEKLKADAIKRLGKAQNKINPETLLEMSKLNTKFDPVMKETI